MISHAENVLSDVRSSVNLFDCYYGNESSGIMCILPLGLDSYYATMHFEQHFRAEICTKFLTCCICAAKSQCRRKMQE